MVQARRAGLSTAGWGWTGPPTAAPGRNVNIVARVPKRPIPASDQPSVLRVTLAYLTHLFMEVFLQTRNALERVDIETYTAAGDMAGREGDMVKTTCD